MRNVLKRHWISKTSQRSSGSWSSYLGYYKHQFLACDCFTVETIWLQTIQVLFFIELGTPRIHLAGCTTDSDTVWVTQQARQRVWELDDPSQSMRFIIHDRDPEVPDSL